MQECERGDYEKKTDWNKMVVHGTHKAMTTGSEGEVR